MIARRVLPCAVLLWVGAAQAQTFPADGSYVPWRCGNRNMFDALRDQPGANDERDIVGDEGNPAGLVAVDTQFLYLRIRLDADAAPGGMLRPSAWGVAFDTNDDARNYEALVILDGQTGVIALHSNTNTTVANSPADPADQPPLSTAMFAQRGRSRAATSTFGNNGDQFLDLSIAWADLAAVNITLTTPVRVWVGTSNTPDRLDADIACHDGAGGAPILIDIGSVRVPPNNPNAPGVDGGVNLDGGIPPGQTRGVEGGPGCPCSVSSRATPGALTWVLATLWLIVISARAARRARH